MKEEIISKLHDFVAKELLAGEDVGLDASTELLNLGLIDSMSVVMLTRFVRDRFEVQIPVPELTPQNLSTLTSIADLVLRLRSASAPAARSPFQHIKLGREGHVATITLNHPPSNAIDGTMVEDLSRTFAQLGADDGVRCIVLTGAGSGFSSGADVAFIQSASPEVGRRFSDEGTELLNKMELLPKPIIAAIRGVALGGGTELAMACDLRIAADSACLGLPELNLGIIPGFGGIQRMRHLVGYGRAMELLLTSDTLTAKAALAFGLVNKVVPDGELMKETMALATALCSRPSLAIGEIKARLFAGASEPLHDGVRNDATAFLRNLSRKDAHEGIAAFLEKRKPQFKGE